MTYFFQTSQPQILTYSFYSFHRYGCVTTHCSHPYTLSGIGTDNRAFLDGINRLWKKSTNTVPSDFEMDLPCSICDFSTCYFYHYLLFITTTIQNKHLFRGLFMIFYECVTLSTNYSLTNITEVIIPSIRSTVLVIRQNIVALGP